MIGKKGNKRYTPKHSLEALRNKWMTVDRSDPRLNRTGQVLAAAAHMGKERFEQVVRELEPEADEDGAGR